MANYRWINLSRLFRLPAGISWSAQRGFFVETPPGPRPFFEWLKANPRMGYSLVMLGMDHAWVKIGPPGDPLMPDYNEEGMEVVTWDEVKQLGNRTEPDDEFGPDVFSDPDIIVFGSGGAFNVTISDEMQPFLSDGERGLILKSGIEFSGKDVLVQTGFEPSELRSMLLLWDKLDWPDHSKFTTEVDGDATYLINAGVMRRTVQQQHGTVFSKTALSRLDMDVFQAVEQVEPARWAVALGSASAPESGEGRGLLAQLNDTVVMPHADVPLEEILNFRVKRRDELLALRSHLDDIYLSIVSATDEVAAFTWKMEALRRAVADQVRVANEGGLKHTLRKAKAAFSAEGLVEVAAAGGLALFPSPTVTAFVVTAGGALAVKVATNLVKPSTGQGPLRYIFSAHRELI